jgi:hypothetical protein
MGLKVFQPTKLHIHSFPSSKGLNPWKTRTKPVSVFWFQSNQSNNRSSLITNCNVHSWIEFENDVFETITISSHTLSFISDSTTIFIQSVSYTTFALYTHLIFIFSISIKWHFAKFSYYDCVVFGFWIFRFGSCRSYSNALSNGNLVISLDINFFPWFYLALNMNWT